MNSYNSLHEREYEEPLEQDREISLGTSTILGIFFGLALICSLFFGLGYSMGRKSTPPAATIQDTTTPPANTSAIKPRSGSLEPIDPAPQPATAAVEPTPASAKPAITAPNKPTLTPVAATIATPGTGTILVQIAAVSHREDAQVLLTTLQSRGYKVFLREEPQDKLLHVQIGPFPTRKDADAMRQRLLSDGYNAIVK